MNLFGVHRKVLQREVALLESTTEVIKCVWDSESLYEDDGDMTLRTSEPCSRTISICPKFYRHFSVRTREYRDESCAVFALVRYLRDFFRENDPAYVLWRSGPGLRFTDRPYPLWVGHVRFSVRYEWGTQNIERKDSKQRKKISEARGERK